jgi:hypothetical protein
LGEGKEKGAGYSKNLKIRKELNGTV